LVELNPTGDRQRAALTATIATVSGSATGPLFGGVLAEYSRWPEQLPFILYGLAILPILGGIAWGARRPHMVRSVGLQSNRTISHDYRWLFLLACSAAFMAFVVQAVFLSLGPSYLATLLDTHRPLVGGAIAFLLLGASAFSQIALRRLPPRVAMPLGVILLGIGLFAFTFSWRSYPFTSMVVSTTLAGFGHGMAFTGSVAFVNAVAPIDRRGFVTSILYVAIYAGGGIPILALGFGASQFGIQAALQVYTSLVAFVCLILSIMLVRAAKERESALGLYS
jgi:MFS family permease